MTTTLGDVRARSLDNLVPPQRERLAEWAEKNIILPAEVADTRGPLRLWPFQPAIADAFTDPDVEKVTLLKPTRVGFTTLITATIAHFIANDPCPVLVYQPTDDEAKGYVKDDIEPIFDASPALWGKLTGEEDEHGRNNITERRFLGGSLKVRGAKSPRNFRRINARVLLMDEVDGMEPTSEGSPIDLASKRTDSFRDRKIIIGSTPVRTATSYVLRSYATSDKRIYEVPCPECGTCFEILWHHIQWDPGRPDTAACHCPNCEAAIAERHKAWMVREGHWRITRPEVQGHAGFKLNALVSLLPNTTWAHLAQEWEEKSSSPDTKQVFINTRLAEGWDGDEETLDPDALEARAEPFGLPDSDDPDGEAYQIPHEALLLTCGVDVQGDRIEATLFGWGRPKTFNRYELPQIFVLGHRIYWGAPQDEALWSDLDALRKTRWSHPLGGNIRISAMAVDSGYETDYVYDYCFPRHGHKVIAVKGQQGFGRPTVQASSGRQRSRNRRGRIYIAGVDGIKRRLMSFLNVPNCVRFSKSLVSDSPNYYEQLASEFVTIRYVKGQPVERFERKPGADAETLDCAVYNFAAREMVNVNWDTLEQGLCVSDKDRKRTKISDFAGMHQ